MKKSIISVALVLSILGGSTGLTSCIGSFSLTNKLLRWNNSIDNKFVNELVFVCFWILPVYEVSGLADLLVLNSIEFWSGSNAVAKGDSVIESDHGKYLVNCDGKGYTITAPDGAVVRLDWDEDDRAWSTNDVNGNRVVFLQFIDDTHMRVPAADGSGLQTIEATPEALYAYQASAYGTDMCMR